MSLSLSEIKAMLIQAKAGNPSVAYELARRYDSISNPSHSQLAVYRKNAFALHQLAATGGHAESQFKLSNRYLSGDGVKKNDSLSKFWGDKYRAQGSPIIESDTLPLNSEIMALLDAGYPMSHPKVLNAFSRDTAFKNFMKQQELRSFGLPMLDDELCVIDPVTDADSDLDPSSDLDSGDHESKAPCEFRDSLRLKLQDTSAAHPSEKDQEQVWDKIVGFFKRNGLLPRGAGAGAFGEKVSLRLNVRDKETIPPTLQKNGLSLDPAQTLDLANFIYTSPKKFISDEELFQFILSSNEEYNKFQEERALLSSQAETVQAELAQRHERTRATNQIPYILTKIKAYPQLLKILSNDFGTKKVDFLELKTIILKGIEQSTQNRRGTLVDKSRNKGRSASFATNLALLNSFEDIQTETLKIYNKIKSLNPSVDLEQFIKLFVIKEKGKKEIKFTGDPLAASKLLVQIDVKHEELVKELKAFDRLLAQADLIKKRINEKLEHEVRFRYAEDLRSSTESTGDIIHDINNIDKKISLLRENTIFSSAAASPATPSPAAPSPTAPALSSAVISLSSVGLVSEKSESSSVSPPRTSLAPTAAIASETTRTERRRMKIELLEKKRLTDSREQVRDELRAITGEKIEKIIAESKESERVITARPAIPRKSPAAEIAEKLREAEILTRKDLRARSTFFRDNLSSLILATSINLSDFLNDKPVTTESEKHVLLGYLTYLSTLLSTQYGQTTEVGRVFEQVRLVTGRLRYIDQILESPKFSATKLEALSSMAREYIVLIRNKSPLRNKADIVHLIPSPLFDVILNLGEEKCNLSILQKSALEQRQIALVDLNIEDCYERIITQFDKAWIYLRTSMDISASAIGIVYALCGSMGGDLKDLGDLRKIENSEAIKAWEKLPPMIKKIAPLLKNEGANFRHGRIDKERLPFIISSIKEELGLETTRSPIALVGV